MDKRSRFAKQKGDSDDSGEEMDKMPGLNENFQTQMPPNPVRVNHNIFGDNSGAPKPPPGLPPKAGPFGRRAMEFTPVDGTKMWDSIEFMPNGTPIYTKGSNTCIFFCIHGAGHSGFSFTMLAQQLQEFATLVTYDIRGHGQSKHAGGEEDLSIDTLVQDAFEVLEFVANKHPTATFAIVGHSMGGSIAVRLAKRLENTNYSEKIVALITVDVVEGTAMEYLPFMVEIISNKPKSFKSEEEAIKWALQTKNVMNLESARISIPPQLKESNTEKGKVWVWRNDLIKSQKFWNDWFKGLSSGFLASKFPKICFIAARERLDKELEIANMQGKFKLVTFPNVGHCMMEDDPVAMAKNCHMVLDRFRCPLSTADIQFIKEHGIPNFHAKLKPYSKN